MANDNLENLRKIVRKRRSAVTAKENRIKRNTGVDIRGTDQDPRRPIGVVDKYNQKQLTTYLGDLDRFMTRNNGFIQGANGGVLPKNLYEEYKRLETKFNSIGGTHFEKVKNLFIPNAGMTIEERDDKLRPDAARAQGDVVNRPYGFINRNPNNIPDEQALKTLITNLKKKVNSGYLPSEIKKQREQLSQMLTVIGDNDLNSRAEKLTITQFDILFNYTHFATNVSAIYFIMQNKARGSVDDAKDSVAEGYSHDIRELFNWAETITESSATDSSDTTSVTNSRKARKKTG